MSDDFLARELEDFNSKQAQSAAEGLRSLLDENRNVGDLLSLDYDEATVLVHDSLRQAVGGIPLGCFLLASRIQPTSETSLDPDHEDTSIILFRVTGKATLPNDSEAEEYRFSAGQRSLDSADQWDNLGKTDQYTLNLLRFAGVRCRVLGTFRMKRGPNATWSMSFGADISNFYSGRGMKVFKPSGDALKKVVNFPRPVGVGKDVHPLHGNRVPIARVRYSATETDDESGSHVPVDLDPTDLLARRTALFGMSRTGKSNTTKVVASSVFKLRDLDYDNGRVGQLIFDVNGEYANENPQDNGCLRNIYRELKNSTKDDVVSYGTHRHPNDPDRKIIKINFFGSDVGSGYNAWNSRERILTALEPLFVGKQLLDESLAQETVKYIKNFRAAALEPPVDLSGGAGTRYRRIITVYRAIIAGAGFHPPKELTTPNIKSLFGKDLRSALANSSSDDDNAKAEYENASRIFEMSAPSWQQFLGALKSLRAFMVDRNSGYAQFNREYMERKDGESWHDSNLEGLLSILDYPNGIRALIPLTDRHDPTTKGDFAESIANELEAGRLVIVDQSMGDPDYNRSSADRIAKAIFEMQKRKFINPEKDSDGSISEPPNVLLYVEEAHNLLPSRSVTDLDPIWSRIAKEGSKYNIGMMYATQEPSSIQSNILSNTDNWFVAHLNNISEVNEVTKYYDFVDFKGPILKVPEAGFIRMRTLSNPYIVPIQVDRFVATSAPESIGDL